MSNVTRPLVGGSRRPCVDCGPWRLARAVIMLALFQAHIVCDCDYAFDASGYRHRMIDTGL